MDKLKKMKTKVPLFQPEWVEMCSCEISRAIDLNICYKFVAHGSAPHTDSRIVYTKWSN